MSANPHAARPVSHFGAPQKDAALTAILLHGRTQCPADMEEWIVRRLDLPRIAFVAPEAESRSWYPTSFLAAREENEPRLGYAIARALEISDELERSGTPRSKQLVIGFSQGACLGCEVIVHGPRGFAGLIAFTGGLHGKPGTTWPFPKDELAGLPVFLGGSDRDPFVPKTRMAETAEAFRLAGAQVTEQYVASEKHEIVDAHLEAARKILRGLLAVAS